MRFCHPNVMSDAEWQALADPTRPIDTAVIPSGDSPLTALVALDTAADITEPPFSSRHYTDTPHRIQSENSLSIQQFIHVHCQNSQQSPCGFRLPLSLLPMLVKATDASWWEQVMDKHPTLAINQLETRLLVMGQMYYTTLCIFLLCQCKSRKTLNPQMTLQDLTDAINDFAKTHQTELAFLTQRPEIIVEPKHVEFALTAMGWQISKHADIAKRTTTISSQNPLTGC